MSDWFKYMSSGAKMLMYFVLGCFITLALYIIVANPTNAFTVNINGNEDFQIALDDMGVEEGDLVRATVVRVDDNPVLGTELWLTDKVVLVGADNDDVKVGDTIKFEVIGGKENIGIWLITYKFIGRE